MGATTRLTRAVGRMVRDPRWGPLIVTMAAEGVYVREYRRRHTFGPVSYGAIAFMAAKAEAEETRRSRRERGDARPTAARALLRTH